MRSVAGGIDGLEAVFDDGSLVADGGLLLAGTVMSRLGLEALIDDTVRPGGSAGSGAGRKVLSLVASMLVGGCCIDDVQRLGSGSAAAVLPFGVVAPSTLGTFLRSFTFGHVRQFDKAAELGLVRAWSVGAAPSVAEMTVDLDLETAIRWVSRNQIEDYMGVHHHDLNADPLQEHFKAVIGWVQANFTEYRPAMKTVDWGSLYDDYKDSPLDPVDIEKQTQRLIDDEDVDKLSGIYPFILTRDEKHLNLRLFNDKTKQRVYQQQDGHCGDPFTFKEMQADHITPWSGGGKTADDNCQMLCKDCNRRKSNI